MKHLFIIALLALSVSSSYGSSKSPKKGKRPSPPPASPSPSQSSMNPICEKGKVFEYDFKSQMKVWKDPETQTGTFTCKVQTSCVKQVNEQGQAGHLYEMKLTQVVFEPFSGQREGFTSQNGNEKVASEGTHEDMSEAFQEPLYFTRYLTGDIGPQILFAPTDSEVITNTKKAILSEWRAPFPTQNTDTAKSMTVTEAHLQGKVDATYFDFHTSSEDSLTMSVAYNGNHFKTLVPGMALAEKEMQYEVAGKKQLDKNGVLLSAASTRTFHFGGNQGEMKTSMASAEQMNDVEIPQDLFQGSVMTQVKLIGTKQSEESFSIASSELDLSRFHTDAFDYRAPSSQPQQEEGHHLQKRHEQVELNKDFFDQLSQHPNDITLLKNAIQDRPEVNVHSISRFLEQESHSDPAVRMACFTALAESGNEKAHQYLANKLTTASADDTIALANSLIFVQSPTRQLVDAMKSVVDQKSTLTSQQDALLLAYGVVLGRSTLANEHAYSDFIVDKLNAPSTSPSQLTHLILTLGNMRNNAPVNSLLPMMVHSSSDVRHATVVALRDHIDSELVRNALAKLVLKETHFDVLASILSHEVDTLKNMRHAPSEDVLRQALVQKYIREASTLDDELRSVFADFIHHFQANSNESHRELQKRGVKWDDAVAKYDSVLPLSDRIEDLSRFPFNKGFIEYKQLGPDVAHLQAGIGMFAGLNKNEGCGKAKMYGRLMTKAKLFTKVIQVGDVMALGYIGGVTGDGGDRFKAYANIGGVTLLDLQHTIECKSDSRPVVPVKEFPIVKEPTTLPVSIFTLYFELNAAAGFKMDLAYDYCATVPKGKATLLPHVYLNVNGETSISVAGGRKAGMGLKGHFNYKMAGTVQVGNLSPELCGACFSAQNGFDEMDLSLTLYVKVFKSDISKKVIDFKLPPSALSDLAKGCIDFKSFIPKGNQTRHSYEIDA